MHASSYASHTRIRAPLRSRERRELSGWLRLLVVYFIVRPPLRFPLALNPAVTLLCLLEWFGARGEERRTFKRNDTVKERSER